MDVRALRHFLAVAETLHFGRAAAMLHMTQPPLSISIKNLESELGGELFSRENRKIELSELGRAMLDPARRAVLAIDEVGSMSRMISSGEMGPLSISFPNGATHRLLPRVLPLFMKRYPGVELRLQEATSSETLDLLDARATDIGIIYFPIACDRPYTAIPGERDELVAILPPGYLEEENGNGIRLSELAGLPFVGFSQPKVPALQAVVSMACQHAGFTPRVVQYGQRMETVISLVRSGVGVSLVPGVCAQTYSHVIQVRRIIDHAAPLQIGLGVMLPRQAMNPRAKNFLAEMNIDISADMLL